MTDKIYYTDLRIVGNLVNYYLQKKDYTELKCLCSSIKNINPLKNDFRKIITLFEQNKQLTDYLYNYHDNSYNFNHYKLEFKKINNIETNDDNTVKILHSDEIKIENNKCRLFVKIIGDTKKLSSILNVKKLQIMWIANTPVWFVPYENLRTVINTARINNIDIKIEKNNENENLNKINLNSNPNKIKNT